MDHDVDDDDDDDDDDDNNLCFLRPTRLYNPNGKSIGSAFFAQLTTESPYALEWGALSP